MKKHGGTEFWCQMGLGFNLCVAPPLDHGAPILEGRGSARAKVRTRVQGNTKERRGNELELTQSQWSYENETIRGNLVDI